MQHHHRLHPRKASTITGAALRLNASARQLDLVGYNRAISNGWNAMTEILTGQKNLRGLPEVLFGNKY